MKWITLTKHKQLQINKKYTISSNLMSQTVVTYLCWQQIDKDEKMRRSLWNTSETYKHFSVWVTEGYMFRFEKVCDSLDFFNCFTFKLEAF